MESTTCSLLDRMGARLGDVTTTGGGWSMPPAELTDALKAAHRLVCQAEALRLALIRQADLRGLAKAADAADTASWMSGMLRMNPREAAGLVKLAAHLDRDLPATSAALAAGEMSVAHAHVISRTVQDLPSDADTPVLRTEIDKTLVEHARDFPPVTLRKLGERVLDYIDPDLADRILAEKLAREEKKAAKQRSMRITPIEDGALYLLRITTDPLTAERLHTLVDPFAKPHTGADTPDLRTPDQRQGDAFAELIEKVHDANLAPKQGGNKPSSWCSCPPTATASGPPCTATNSHPNSWKS